MRAIFQPVATLESIQEFIAPPLNKEETIVILDMDLTLTIPPLPVLAYLLSKGYREKLKKLLASLTKTQQHMVLGQGLQLSKHSLIEKEAPALVKHIQDSDIKTIVLTASLTGQINHEAPLELQRFDKLKELGIVLGKACDEEKIILRDSTNPLVKPTIYYRGILCTNGEPGINIKGPALVSFLKHIHFLPKKVVMVDDKKQHLTYVYESLTALIPDIEFVGLEYRGAQKQLSNKVNDQIFNTYWQDLVQNVLYDLAPLAV